MRRAAVKTGLCKRVSAKPVSAAHVFVRFCSDSGVEKQVVAFMIALLCSVCAKVGGGLRPPPLVYTLAHTLQPLLNFIIIFLRHMCLKYCKNSLQFS